MTSMMASRRDLLTVAGGLSLGALAPRAIFGEDAPKNSIRNRIAVSTYSFWQFNRRELRDIEKCIDMSAEWGFDGVELLHRQMESEEKGYMQRLKRRAFVNGLDL